MLDLIKSIQSRDPARPSALEIILAYNGFHAIILHRASNAIWKIGLKPIARMLANITRILTGIEIHPQATIGQNVFIDHGTGVVIGQTAIIEDNVTLYHGVTPGGKGEPSNTGKRHPTIQQGAIIGAGAQVLGNITVGQNAKVGSSAVVTRPVSAGTTVVGNPARELKPTSDQGQAYGLPQNVKDPYAEKIQALEDAIKALQDKQH